MFFHRITNAERLADLWGINLKSATRTLTRASYNNIRTHEVKLSRRFGTDQFQQVLSGQFPCFYKDTLFFKVKTCAQIFSNKACYVRIYSIENKFMAHQALSCVIHDIVIPKKLHADSATELARGEMRKKINKYEIKKSLSESCTAKQILLRIQ